MAWEQWYFPVPPCAAANLLIDGALQKFFLQWKGNIISLQKFDIDMEGYPHFDVDF
jgi:hypothetical protein